MSARLALFLLVSAALTPPSAAAASCQVRSGWSPVVELYTSQGCSSCPPADAWLGSLAQAAAARQVVPLAFHVDYCDYLGWRDPLSQAGHSARQRLLARAEGGTVVYTPQVRLSGRDFRDWRSADTVRSALTRPLPRPDGTVELSLDLRDDVMKLAAQAVLPAGTVGYLAVYERALASRVTGGENSGRTLEHDFVVRRWLGPFTADAQGRLTLDRDIALDRTWKRRDLGVALIQADATSGASLYGATLPVCASAAGS